MTAPTHTLQAPRRSLPSPAPVSLTVTCDRSGCPAFAVHELDIYGQDFFFCHHHWVELVGVVPVRAVQPRDPDRDREPAGVLA